MWDAVEVNDRDGMNCNANGPCPRGPVGGMVPIAPTAADKAKLKEVVGKMLSKI